MLNILTKIALLHSAITLVSKLKTNNLFEKYNIIILILLVAYASFFFKDENLRKVIGFVLALFGLIFTFFIL